MSTETVIIGGGAAGMLCAALAAERGCRVTLLEPNRVLGKKLRITGKGRCNVTNHCSVQEVLQNIPGGGKFLYSALGKLSPDDAMALFEEMGVPLKTERGNRVVPVSDRAGDVAGALERRMHRAGVRIVHSAAKHILIQDGAVCAVETAEGRLACRAAVLCTGGLSYPGTGSTGAGFRMARELGHTVTPLRPSLVPLTSPAPWCAQLQGLSLRNVTLSAYDGDGALLYRELGEMLFTHFGVSGPLVLSASAHMRGLDVGSCRLEIDLKPGLDETKLDARLLRDLEKYRNREMRNALDELLPRAMIPVVLELAGIPAQQQANAVTRPQRRALSSVLKAFPVPLSGTRSIDEAIVTAGGVSLSEVNPRTMQSRLVQGLFFAGEILDLDAYTGGFNLQIAWSTAWVAAHSL